MSIESTERLGPDISPKCRRFLARELRWHLEHRPELIARAFQWDSHDRFRWFDLPSKQRTGPGTRDPDRSPPIGPERPHAQRALSKSVRQTLRELRWLTPAPGWAAIGLRERYGRLFQQVFLDARLWGGEPASPLAWLKLAGSPGAPELPASLATWRSHSFESSPFVGFVYFVDRTRYERLPSIDQVMSMHAARQSGNPEAEWRIPSPDEHVALVSIRERFDPALVTARGPDEWPDGDRTLLAEADLPE